MLAGRPQQGREIIQRLVDRRRGHRQDHQQIDGGAGMSR